MEELQNAIVPINLTGEDVRDFIKRQLDATRSQWLANIRQVMHAPDGAEVAVIETAERDDEGRPTPIPPIASGLSIRPAVTGS